MWTNQGPAFPKQGLFVEAGFCGRCNAVFTEFSASILAQPIGGPCGRKYRNYPKLFKTTLLQGSSNIYFNDAHGRAATVGGRDDHFQHPIIRHSDFTDYTEVHDSQHWDLWVRHCRKQLLGTEQTIVENKHFQKILWLGIAICILPGHDPTLEVQHIFKAIGKQESLGHGGTCAGAAVQDNFVFLVIVEFVRRVHQVVERDELRTEVELFVFPGFADIDEDKFFTRFEFAAEVLNCNFHVRRF